MDFIVKKMYRASTGLSATVLWSQVMNYGSYHHDLFGAIQFGWGDGGGEDYALLHLWARWICLRIKGHTIM